MALNMCSNKSSSDSEDFVFCITNAQKLSSADELFSNGKILPTQVSTANAPPQQTTRNKMLKEFLLEPDDYDEVDIEEHRPNNSVKLFWRSSSVNSDAATRGKRVLPSSMHFLSRSYSTGSAPNTHNHSLQKHSSATSTAYYFYDSCQNPSFNNNFSRNNGVRISPILNLPHRKPTRRIFGFASLFCNARSRRRTNTNS